MMMTTDEHNAQLKAMLEEVRLIRETLNELSESAQEITEAIRGVLKDNDPVGFGEEYLVAHGEK